MGSRSLTQMPPAARVVGGCGTRVTGGGTIPGARTQPVLFTVLLGADTNPFVRARPSDLPAFQVWRPERGLPPVSAQRAHKVHAAGLQEVRQLKPSTGSRRCHRRLFEDFL